MDENFPLEYWKTFPGPYPQMVFCDNARGFFSLGVKVRTRGFYGHFMWMVGKNELASQWWYFQRQELDHYEGCYLKFISKPSWTDEQRRILLKAINADLDLSPWKTRYDVLGVIGQLFGCGWLRRTNLYYCSERADYLELIDGTYGLKHPTPSELNAWTKQSGKFEVTGRYTPE
jgi:hypothetical protein